MKINEIMTKSAQSCGPEDTLSTAAKKMWDSDCGALPVLDHQGKVIGMLTDRDICMSVLTKDQRASNISVWDTTAGKVYSCSPDDDVKYALSMMEKERVRRLPVVDSDGGLVGVLSVNDIVLKAEEESAKKQPAVSCRDVLKTLSGICAHQTLAGVS